MQQSRICPVSRNASPLNIIHPRDSARNSKQFASLAQEYIDEQARTDRSLAFLTIVVVPRGAKRTKRGASATVKSRKKPFSWAPY